MTYDQMQANFIFPVVNIQQVYDWLVTNVDDELVTTAGEHSLEIVVKAPFPETWFEFEHKNLLYGVIVQNVAFDDKFVDTRPYEIAPGVEPAIFMRYDSFRKESDGRLTKLGLSYSMLFDINGHWMQSVDQKGLEWIIDHATEKMTWNEEVWERNKIQAEFAKIINVAMYLMTLSGVRVVEKSKHVTRQQRRFAERNNIPAPIESYKVIELGGIYKEVSAGSSTGTGAKKSLHICRGHIARYHGDSKLFGKYNGDFWIPATVKGDPKIGISKHDYKVVKK